MTIDSIMKPVADRLVGEADAHLDALEVAAEQSGAPAGFGPLTRTWLVAKYGELRVDALVGRAAKVGVAHLLTGRTADAILDGRPGIVRGEPYCAAILARLGY